MPINYDNEYPHLQKQCRKLKAENKRLTALLAQANATYVGMEAEIKRLRDKIALPKFYTQDSAKLRAENKRLRDALQEVSRTLGPYKIDPHEFAVSVIENMQDIALNAIVDNWETLKQGSNKE